jgi:hypothetical protein
MATDLAMLLDGVVEPGAVEDPQLPATSGNCDADMQGLLGALGTVQHTLGTLPTDIPTDVQLVCVSVCVRERELHVLLCLVHPP